MDAQADILARYPVPRRRLTVRDYHRLGEAGILRSDDRVELLAGQLVEMAPIGPRHALVVDVLNEFLVTAFASRAHVRTQNPVVLDDLSEPQPDFALLRRHWDGYPHAHPRPADIFLLIEVSDTSLAIDRGVKLELYARAGVREVWIVDLTSNAVLVHRHPSGTGYASVVRIQAPGLLEVEAFPGTTILAGDLFF